MKECHNCQKPVEEKALKCPRCGKYVVWEEEQIVGLCNEYTIEAERLKELIPKVKKMREEIFLKIKEGNLRGHEIDHFMFSIKRKDGTRVM